MNHLNKSDLLAAGTPLGGSVLFKAIADLTLADWNSIAGIAGAVLGSAFLLWRWRNEVLKARRGKRPSMD